MSVDYNLVIIGGSLTARYAASFASRFKARVALVEPSSFQISCASLDSEVAIAQILHQTAHQCPRYPAYEIEPAASSESSTVDWGAVRSWGQRLLSQEMQRRSLPSLAMQGVDVIVSKGDVETGEFCRRPRFGIAANGRILQAHAYLLAPMSQPKLPDIEGLSSVPYLTVDTLLDADLDFDGQAVILGDTPRSIELAQALAQLGMATTLVWQAPQFLSEEDHDAAHLLLALLEASGVDVLTDVIVNHVKCIKEQTWVQAGNRAIATDYLILATARVPKLASLNLDAATIRPIGGRLKTTQRLRTSHPRVYACGEAITPLHDPSSAQHQAEYAVKNALFLSTRQYADQTVPTVIRTNPPLARVGLTEHQANQKFDGAIVVLNIPIKEIARSHIDCEQTGFLKVITTQNGRLLGAHCIGQAAGEIIAAIALSMSRHLTINTMSAIRHPSTTYASIINHLSLAWETERLKGDRFRSNLLELVMNWQRDWTHGS